MPRFAGRKKLVHALPFIPDPPEPELGDDRFSRDFKNWREWNVAVQFLSNLHIGVDESEVFCCPNDPPDILYKDGRFETKEIMDKGRRRHDEVKAARSSERQSGGKPKFRSASVIDLTPQDAGSLVIDEMKGLSRYQEEIRAKTDLLFYINKLDHWFDDGPMPSTSLFSLYGWRSVSAVVASSTSIVFHAVEDAPTFLRDNAGHVRKRLEPFNDDC